MLSEYGPTAQMALAGAGLVLGAVLWLLGKKLTRPCGAACGMLFGLAGGAALAGPEATDELRLMYLVGGALAGALLAWILFRIWVGILLAIVLSTGGPAMYMAWQGKQPPPAPAVTLPQTANSEGLGINRQQAEEMAKAWWTDAQNSALEWWKSLDGPEAATATGLAIGGAILGLLVGLLFPYRAAAAACALVGSVLIVGVLAWLAQREGFAWLTTWLGNPRQAVAAVGLITAVGVGFQWTVWRKRADK
ncbi:MAG: hypothetical protein IT443_01130 [Phycisphaeraceae bacterium]|nr:hypothetical protein [Phycisphaeraceae bacterium]